MLTIVFRFLRNPNAYFEEVQNNEGVRRKVIELAVSSVLFLMCYGVVLGLPHPSPLQAVSAALKMPLLFLATMFFCLPALYFFALAVLNTGLRLIQITAMLMAGIGVTAFLLLGLAPVTLFFDLTSDNYPFFQLLAVAFVGISGTIGLSYTWQGMTSLDLTGSDRPNGPGRWLLCIWVVLYAFVSAQMTWRLTPMIADPAVEFHWFKASNGNFYVDVIQAIERIAGAEPAERGWESAVGLAGFCLASAIVLLILRRKISGANRRRPTQAGAEPTAPGQQIQGEATDRVDQ